MSSSEGPTNTSAKVKVFLPKAIILGFNGTLAPVDWEDTCILPYIREQTKEYLKANWYSDIIFELLPKLRQESFDQHFVYEISECPVVADDEQDINEQILSTNDFLIWQIDNRKETKDSQKIFEMVWKDGLHKHLIKVPLFKDVIPALKLFKDKFKMKIALFSTLSELTARLLFENTLEGDISQYFDNYFDSRIGSSKDIESFKKMANELKVEAKDILYVMDYGQSAKLAKEVGYYCLLICRPHNRKIRVYYLLRFDQISSLLDIEFVQRQ